MKNKNLKLLSIAFSFIILGYVVVINMLSQQKFARIDLTQNRIFSISQVSKNKLRSLDDILTIELYFSDNLPQNLKRVQNDIRDLMDEFRIAGGRNVKIVWKNPLRSQTDRHDAIAMNIPPIRVQSIERDRTQMVDGYMGIAVRFAGRTESIPLVQATDNFEYEIIQRVFRLTAQTLPTVGIVKTDSLIHIDSSWAQFYAIDIPEDRTRRRFRPIFQALSSFYDVRYIDFAHESEIDPAIKTIIVPGEDAANYFFKAHAVAAIDQFLMRGGNVIILAQRFAIDLQNQREAGINLSSSFLYKMLEAWGVNVESEMMIDASAGQIAVPQRTGATIRNIPIDYPMFVLVNENGFNRNIAPLASMQQVIFPWATPVFVSENIDPETIADTLIMSSPFSTTIDVDRFGIAPNQNWEFFFEHAQRNNRLRQQPLAIRLSGKINSIFNDTTLQRPAGEILLSTRNGSAIIIGNAEFATQEFGTPQNISLLLNLTDWLTLDENLIGIRSRNMVDRSLRHKTLFGDEENRYIEFVKILNLTLMPIILIALGLLLFIKRKQSQERKK